jgi:CheY-like chemotaxis protein
VMESTLRMAWNEIRHRSRLVKNYGVVPRVEASESRLGQVFLNIVVNAAQAMAEGQANKNELRVTTKLEDDRVVIEIGDTGPGIAKEVMARIFTPFVTTKPAETGTGLGLSICHRIITEFGGEIGVTSQPGQGTVFRVALPLAISARAESARPVAAVAGKAVRQGRVLVIDDDAIVTRVVERTLASEHKVVAMEGARAALDRIVGGERFDVILCDLMMPEMTGMDFHGELLAQVPDQATAIIFLTGGAFSPRAREFLSGVRNPRIEKPFDALQMRALINDRIR